MKKYKKLRIKRNFIVLFLQNKKLRGLMLKIKRNLYNQTSQNIQFQESFQHFMDKTKK